MTTRFIADLHLDHNNIMKFRPCAPPHVQLANLTLTDEYPPEVREAHRVDAHNLWLYDQWHSVVKKRDTVWVLGDVAFTSESLAWFGTWTGIKKLVRGNHDNLRMEEYYDVFKGVYGIVRYKKYWLTHCPIHPQEMRGLKNIHGHLHDTVIMRDPSHAVVVVPDDRYIGVSVDQCDGVPVSLEYMREHHPVEDDAIAQYRAGF